jgi:hypothetical protein
MHGKASSDLGDLKTQKFFNVARSALHLSMPYSNPNQGALPRRAYAACPEI